MPDQQDLSIQVRGVEKLQEFLKTVPRGTMRAAIAAVAQYLVGDTNHGLRHPVAYRYVDRTTAYGQPFFTDKQRRWFFAALNRGDIHPGSGYRSGATENGWYYSTTNDGYAAHLYNDTPGAPYVYGNINQARQPALVGWRKMQDIISTNINGAIRAGQQAVNRWIRDNSSK